MFKMFGLGDDEEVDNSSSKNHKIHKNEDFGHEELEDIHIDEEQNEEEVGQVALDVLENYDAVYILAPLAGVRLSDIDIAIHDTTLTLSGVRNKPREFYEHSMQIKNSECFWGKFLRRIVLPENMDFSQVKAVMEQNLLVIHIPKIRFSSKNIRIEKVGEYF